MEKQATPEDLLERFGLRAFRPGQREAVVAAMAGRDTLVVMPTGGGKSLCYQLPALAGSDLVVVVSPLIALMADQWRRLKDSGVHATMLASGMEEGHNHRALHEIESGATQLVLAAPERFASSAFREALARRKVALFVVDEAHCVSEWGHDFRPDYLRLKSAIEALGRPAVMAATATATPRVAQEIAQRLGLREWVSVRSGFDRPNLVFDVVTVEGKGAVTRKRAALLHVLHRPEARPAIVYCGTRKDTDEVCSLLAGSGIATVAYHAGMAPRDRHASQEAFMRGEAEVVVATNAFGMGVDKADVRTVAHWALPTSLEAYYQEAGRGGRDGLSARALLLAARMDLGRLIRFNTERNTTVEDVRAYVGSLRAHARDGVATLAPSWHGEWNGDGNGDGDTRPGPALPDERERILMSIAEQAGAVELEPGNRGALRVRLTGKGDPRKAYAAIKAAKDRGWESYRAIERFISNGELCRRRQILDHFGDHEEARPTGRCCDVCETDGELAEAVARALDKPTAPTQRGRIGRMSANGRAGRAAAGATVGSLVPDAEPLDPVDESHFEVLKAWRLARSEGKPAYTVATNAALEELLRCQPESLEELLRIRGIGPAFCEKHGEALLRVLGELSGSALPAAG
ncbi:MAG TPA: RecQ family ATP-dependent DNA helicase [Solirubrobacteraceae bacterium]|jgi:ATP-dependent DNA helicase RecQ|nr:RecQ family ATP-dependent DNA helicase [Solirubrobacteraceae bacterium]